MTAPIPYPVHSQALTFRVGGSFGYEGPLATDVEEGEREKMKWEPPKT